MKALCIFILLILINSYLFAQTATYTTAGANTWTCPTGVTSATVECWGGGGGGGNSNNSGGNGGSGGGGSAYSQSVFTVSSGTYYLSVGVGGVGAPASSTTAAQTGGDTWFNKINVIPTDNSGILAKGGGYGGNDGGSAGVGGNSGSGFWNTVTFSGGNGGVGGNNGGAGGGSSAGTASIGTNAANGNGTTGAIAPTGGGNGGDGSSTTNGASGFVPGGGGGGSDDNATRKGGDGAVGKVVITWPTLTIGNNTIAAANVCPNALGVRLHGFTLTGTSGGGTVTGLTFVTNGTYVASEISNFKLYYTTTSTFATTNLLATISAPTAAGTQTFPSFSYPVGTTTIWFWITMDLYDATTGNTISVNGTQISNITETGAELLGGPSTAGGTQTFLSTAVGNAGTISATPGSLYICAGQSGVGPYTVTAISGATGYTWSLPTGASIATGANTNSITVDYSGGAVSGNITVQGTDAACPGRISPNLAIGIMNVPVIVTNPVSIYGCNGTPVSFSIVATGAGLTYQWQENGVNLSNGGVYSGVYTTTLIISDPVGLNGRTYRCVVTGQCSTPATSTSATLNVLGSGLSGTKNIPGDYATLEAAFTDINNKGLIDNLYLRIGSDIIETGAATLSQWNNCGNSGYTVTVYPTGATRTISGNIATSLIILNGADYVTFDGRIDMTGAPNSLVFSNTNTSGSTLKFIADATYNTVKYCTLQGVSNVSTTGVIWFSTATNTGNNYNNINYCNINDGASTPTFGIYSLGTASKENINNNISNCNIYNHHNTTAGGSTIGLYLENYNSKWTISGNSFYQTVPRTMNSYRALLIAGSAGDEFIITNNYIGGQAPLCAGASMNYSNSGWVTLWYGMQVDVSNTGKSIMTGNIIKNITCTLVPSSTGSIRFAGFATLGRVDMTGNIIGDNSTNSIQIVYNDNSTYTGGHVGVYKLGNGDILNNTIGSISMSGTCGDLSSLYGIYATGSLTTDMLINNNIIGNISTANSIQTSSGATPIIDIYGILFGTAGSFTSTVSNNIIANISNNCTSNATSTFGVSNVATAGVQRVIGNQIFNISTAGTSILTNTWPALAGIKNNNTTTGNFEISNNKIYSLSATGNAAINLHGILLNNAATGSNVVSRNLIHSFYTSSTTAEQNGIFLFSGTATLRNNMIRLGIDKDGNSITTSALIRGILKSTASNTNIYYNSIYIGGTGVASGTVNTFAISRTATATDNIINNILFNARSNSTGTGKHYAIWINATTTLTSNYNNLYVTGTGGCISNAGGGCSFANWQALGFDASGRNLDPSFTNATGNFSAIDLHLSNDASPMIDRGFYLPTVLVDYDGQQRKIGPTPPNNDGNDPCIGADERIVPPSAQSSFGIFIADNQSGTIADCEIYATGGTPGGGGYPVYVNGVSTNYANINISTYQVITQQNIQCTNTNINFTTADPTPDWLLGNGSTPNSGSTTPITTQYSSTGRKDIIESIKIFKDFTNITMATPSSGTILGAPSGAGCPTTYAYSSSVAGSAGFTYAWSSSAPGGCTTTIANPTLESTDITFVNTTGYNQVFVLYLDIVSECCGPLTQVVRYITIYPGPLPPTATDASPNVCTGGSQTISVSSPEGSYSYGWYTASIAGTLLGSGTSYTVNPAISGVTSYWIQATNMYGCVSARTEVVVTGDDTTIPTVPSNSTCGSNDVTLSITAPVVGYTYNWYSGSCGGTLVQSSQGSTYTTSVSSTTTFYVAAVPPGCGASACQAPVITYNAPPPTVFWLGAVGGANNWFNTANWTDGCIPACNANVSIPDLATDPDIGYNATNNAACQDINLQAGAVLSFSDSRAMLDVCGNFTHAGIITTNNLGKINFVSSSSSQTYTRTGTGNLNSVEINNTFTTPTVTINSADMILGSAGTLTFSNGKLVTGANKIIITNTAFDAVSGHSTLRYVFGNLRRYVVTPASYDFPVGTNANYEYSNLNITALAGAGPFIDAFFTTPNAGTTPSGISIWGIPVTTLLDYGFWTLTPTNVTSITYNITLTSRGHTNGGTIASQHTIIKRPDNASAWVSYVCCHSNATQSGTGTNPITAVLTGMTSFSDVAIARSDVSPLPIELLSFVAICNNNTVDLIWSTASEMNNDYFTIERSSDGTNFIPIKTVKGAGNSNQIINYNAIDEKPLGGISYYRLKQTDFDGKFTYSNIIIACNGSLDNRYINVNLYPNPANEGQSVYLDIEGLKDKEILVVVYNTFGQQLFSKIVISNTNGVVIEAIDSQSHLPPGVYYVVASSNSNLFNRKLVIKQ